MPGLNTHEDAPQEILEHEVVITVPTEGEMKGVVFSLHGCLQLTKEWGYPSETCPECHGEVNALQYSSTLLTVYAGPVRDIIKQRRIICSHHCSCFTVAQFFLCSEPIGCSKLCGMPSMNASLQACQRRWSACTGL